MRTYLGMSLCSEWPTSTTLAIHSIGLPPVRSALVTRQMLFSAGRLYLMAASFNVLNTCCIWHRSAGIALRRMGGWRFRKNFAHQLPLPKEKTTRFSNFPIPSPATGANSKSSSQE